MSISYRNPVSLQTQNAFLQKKDEEDYAKTLAEQTSQVLPLSSSKTPAGEILRKEGITSAKDIIKKENVPSAKEILQREGITSAADIVQKETGVTPQQIKVPDFLGAKDKGIKVPDAFGLPTSTIETVQSAARSVYGRDLTPEQLQRYSNDLSTGKITQDNILGALAYSAETTTEKARANTLLGYNYHELDPVEQMTVQLGDQYKAISTGGYKYRYEDRLPTLFKNQAEALAKAGVESIYDVGVKTVEVDSPINVIKRGMYDSIGNFTGKFEYLKQVGTEGSGESETPIYEPLNAYELANLNEVGSEETGISKTLTKVPVKRLYNTKTGELLKTGFREEGSLRDYQGLDIWGGANLGKGLDLFGIQVTEDGQPVFVPVWQETSDKKKIGQIVAMVGSVFAPQIGSYLYGLSGAAGAAAGAATVSAASQLISTGKINVGQLALSAGTAYIGADVGLTGADIATDAAQLAAQGLPQSQIASTIAATGVNQITANIAATLAVGGVSATVAPMITSSLINMGVSGLHAAVTGQDVGKALQNGAVLGVANAISVKVIDDLFGQDNIRTIARNLNLTPNQVRTIGIGSLSNAIAGEATGRGDFFNILTTNLISGGVSTSAANKMVSFLGDKVSPSTRAFIATTTKGAADISVKAALNNRSVEDTLKYYAPSIIASGASAASR
jgi:hypothetical protein